MKAGAVRSGLAIFALALTVCPLARAGEHVTLRNGFELNCVRSERVGDKVRLYLAGDTPAAWNANYLEIARDAIVRVETVADAPRIAVKAAAKTGIKTGIRTGAEATAAAPTRAEIHEMLAHSGEAHHIDTDLLASVMKAESGGQVRAVSRAGAQGLMQLMPKTASEMGVEDAFRAEENIAGGTAYLDELLTRYRDNIALALAAYNAGPAAVDRYHGVPPYRETQAYVARVIREFNRRKQAALVAQAR